MSESISDTVSSSTERSVGELAQDLDKFKEWFASADGKSNIDKIGTILVEAALTGQRDFCQLILYTLDLPNDFLAVILAFASSGGNLPVAQLIVSHSHLSAEHLQDALTEASSYGYMEIVKWLLSEMKLSHDDNVIWLLAAASACGDINSVRMVATQTGIAATVAMSYALRSACYRGKFAVVDWLTMYTTADASLCGKLGGFEDLITSLSAACCVGHSDIVRILLYCVTPHTINLMGGDYRDSALHFVMSFVEVRDEIWYRSLHCACSRENVDEVANIVMNYTDKNVNMTDQSSKTALHLVCRNGTVEIVRVLLSVFASVDITDDHNSTPLQIAQSSGNSGLVPYLSRTSDMLSTRENPTSTITNIDSTISVTPATVGDPNVSNA